MTGNDLDPATARRIQARMSRLTPRERRILHYAAHGEAPTTIGRHFNLSARTITVVLDRISAKLGGVPLPLLSAYIATVETIERLGGTLPW